jgi:hypothetical protein
MQKRSEDVDALVSVSNFFAVKMKQKMGLPDEKVQTIHLGVEVDDYTFISTRSTRKGISVIFHACAMKMDLIL